MRKRTREAGEVQAAGHQRGGSSVRFDEAQGIPAPSPGDTVMMAKQSGSDSENTPQSGASLQSGSVSVEEQPERTWSAPAQTWRQTFSENEWKQDFREIKDLGKGSSRARLRRSLLLIPFFLLGRLTFSSSTVTLLDKIVSYCSFPFSDMLTSLDQSMGNL